MKCNGDCLNCKYDDCILEECEADPFSDEYDQKIISERKQNEIDSVITLETETVRTRKRGRPRKTEEAKALRKKMTCRERYKRNRERLLAQSKAYYAKNIQNPEFREKLRQRDRERYLRKKEKQWD